LDLVATYGPLQTQAGLFSFTVAGNKVLQNKIIGAPKEPAIIRESGASILNANLRTFVETSRPESKIIAGIEFSNGPLTVWVHQTRIGSTKFQDTDNGSAIMEHIEQVFKPAMLTDLNMQWKASKKVAWNVSISNLFNRLPKWELHPLDATGTAYLNDAQKKRALIGALTFNGRYDITSYSGAQYSQLGTTFLISVLFNL
jgi:iron complex outermembrane receptor protein